MNIQNYINALPEIFTVDDVLDCDFMKSVIDSHFEKYKAFIKRLKKVDDKALDAIKSIACTSTNTSVTFKLQLSQGKHKHVLKKFDDAKVYPNGTSTLGFNVEVTTSTKYVNILIENDGFLEEVEIYEGRFDTN